MFSMMLLAGALLYICALDFNFVLICSLAQKLRLQ